MRTPMLFAIAILVGVVIGWYLSLRFEKQRTPGAPSQPAAPVAQPAPTVNLGQAEREELERLRRDVPELLRLRNQLTQLRQERETDKQREPAQVHNSMTGRFIPSERLTHVGFGTPEAALLTFMAASNSGNLEQTLAAGVPLPDGQSIDRAEYEQRFRQLPRYLGMQLLARKVVSDDKVDLQTVDFVEGKAPTTHIHHMVKVGTERRYSDSSEVSRNWDREGQVQSFIPE